MVDRVCYSFVGCAQYKQVSFAKFGPGHGPEDDKGKGKGEGKGKQRFPPIDSLQPVLSIPKARPLAKSGSQGNSVSQASTVVAESSSSRDTHVHVHVDTGSGL